MADVFVSYAKTDRALASKLVAMLEAEGWSIWWDTSLGAADLYRDEIMKQLVSARAVIAIWTPNSIRSDWVRAEAGTAKKDGKLIPVKTADVAYADIPLPFGEMHTENLEASQLIRAAVVAQLAKPVVEPTAWALLTKGFRYELLTWIGIVGGALTLFTNLGAVLKLADWARLLVQHWKEWEHAFWLSAFGWLGIHLPPEWAPLLSFLLFWSLLAIGQTINFKSMIKSRQFIDVFQGKSFQLISIQEPVLALGAMFVATFAFVILVGTLSAIIGESDIPRLFIVNVLVNILLPDIIPLIIIILLARHRLHTAISVGLLAAFFGIIVSIHSDDVRTTTVLRSVAAGFSGWILTVILLSVAPAKALSRRLIFLALGLLLLIALNELSKLGLDVTAPKLQG